ncbi:TIGR03086 family metal-binding protein [Nocardioides jiangxiensis]|uniref:TIGR03086 family metal-binding protein n=1 Tax=Nocardioides jiangxiensis TaxID=3064524 RepID=A0ABT9B2J7_9ACTN|nr:TIGR03086 family metal-binding protein [Nocardioides sp. WY-20]MDO7869082.1 TIGR03086 family metal-binding protein [Nocardioides sp. WY-20]
MDARTLHRATVDRWQQLLDGVPDDAWAAPTPCAEWDVRALVNHVVGEELWLPPLLAGRTIAEVGDRFDGDLLGADPKAAGRRAAGAAAEAGEGVADGQRVQLSYGEEAASEYLMQLAADHLVHGWDLAAASGQDRRLDPELVDAVAAWFRDREDMYRAGNAIGPRATSAGDPQAELLAAFGRTADWSPG